MINTPTPALPSNVEPWVIRKSGAFYRANRSGYTVHIEAAGIYTREEAEREARIEDSISAHPLSEYVGEITEQRDRAQALLDKLTGTLARASTPTEKEAGEITPAMREAGYKAVGRFHYAPDSNAGWAEQAEYIYKEIARARSASVTSRLDKALANFLAVERAEDESFWPLYREVRDAYDEMKRGGSASVTDAPQINVHSYLRDDAIKILRDQLEKASHLKPHEMFCLVSTPPAHGEGELAERAAQIAAKISKREDDAARELFCKPGEFKHRHASDVADEIESGIRALSHAPSPPQIKLNDEAIEALIAEADATNPSEQSNYCVSETVINYIINKFRSPAPPQQDGSGLVEAAETAQAWLDRWAEHVGRCPDGQVCTCGLNVARSELNHALASTPKATDHAPARAVWVVPLDKAEALVKRTRIADAMTGRKAVTTFADDIVSELRACAITIAAQPDRNTGEEVDRLRDCEEEA